MKVYRNDHGGIVDDKGEFYVHQTIATIEGIESYAKASEMELEFYRSALNLIREEEA